MAKKPILPKLMRPRQSGVLARERLFEALDRGRQCPVTWISGPAGSGKTTLVASYVEQRRLSCMWYQFDATDNDPATLFYYLRECVPPKRTPLPLFAGHYQTGLADFSRRFFRIFFERCPAASVLVLDGLEISGPESPLATILHEAAQEIPSGVRMIIASRDEPPPLFARLELQQQVARMGWDVLRLSLAETRAIAEGLRAFGEKTIEALHQRCGGWIAGLRLVLEHQPHTGDGDAAHAADKPDALFRFIAAEIFGQLPEHTRAVLLRTSLLPEVSEHAARTLTRNPEAWSLIAELANRHLFVDKLSATPVVFRYHALFKEFLVTQTRTALSAFEFKTLQREAGDLLAASGRVDHAVPLLTQAGEWIAASRLILEEASNMMARGHSQTLRQWVSALPAWYVDATPRLLYCLGIAQSASEPNDAMSALERAHDRFRTQRDTLGQALSAAGIIQAYYFRLDSYLGMERWAETLDDLLQNGLILPSPETELHVMSMLQIALTYRRPNHPRLPQYVERVLGLIARRIEVNQRVVSASMLLPYLDWFAPEKAALLASHVRPALRAPGLIAFNHVWWLLAEVHHIYTGDTGEGLGALIAQIEQIADRCGLRLGPAVSAALSLMSVVSRGETTGAEAEVARAMRAINLSRRQEEVNLRIDTTEIRLQERDSPAAVDSAQRALQVCRDTGIVPAEMETLGLLAIALSETDRGEEAIASVNAAREIARGVSSRKLEFHHHLIEAYVRLNLGEHEAAHALLREGFAIAREQGYLKGFPWVPHMMAQLCAQAISASIEVPYVHHIIRTRKLAPPPQVAGDHWPWPIKIYVLGNFEVQLNGNPLVFSGKAQKKPLDLIKALVAKGSAGTDQSLIAQELWSDSEGDAAESALRMALHRLRKLLGSEGAVQVQEGKLKLNSAVCWVDAWAFEHTCRELESAPYATPSGLASEHRTVFDLYRGEAFATESLQPWMISGRDRWRVRFLRAVRIIGQAQKERKAWAQASDTYESGIAADPMCEEFYQQLIDCYIHQGKAGEAYAIYRRCRDILCATLGVKPSAKTESLRDQIAAQGAA